MKHTIQDKFSDYFSTGLFVHDTFKMMVIDLASLFESKKQKKKKKKKKKKKYWLIKLFSFLIFIHYDKMTFLNRRDCS